MPNHGLLRTTQGFHASRRLSLSRPIHKLRRILQKLPKRFPFKLPKNPAARIIRDLN